MSRFLKVWSTFSPAVKKRGTVFNLRIVDMPERLREDVVNLYIKYFIKEEATFKAVGIPKSIEATKEICEPIFKATQAPGFHTVICSLDNEDEQIKHVVGASLMTLASARDPEPENKFETPEVKKLFELSHGLTASFDEVKVFKYDRYFSDRGMFVCPQYRGLGIAQEFLRVRRIICREHGIPIHGAWMTSPGTQKAAERDGWETVCEIQTKELEMKYGVTFENAPPTFKFMIARTQ